MHIYLSEHSNKEATTQKINLLEQCTIRGQQSCIFTFLTCNQEFTSLKLNFSATMKLTNQFYVTIELIKITVNIEIFVWGNFCDSSDIVYFEKNFSRVKLKLI